MSSVIFVNTLSHPANVYPFLVGFGDGAVAFAPSVTVSVFIIVPS
ncbi:hypothetical protein GGW01_000995 [Clostridium beijerinckii]|nr:hypothetical protein [Clostridium beijerinckii]MBA2898332.1 hypothetical protein [Clostridium beijerinckii]MBA2908882.1 hypothetical protein [Clostridium beijerinckii]